MIGYLEGNLLKKEEERILLLANQVGYEVMIPSFVMETLEKKKLGDKLALYTYFYQAERQPAPVLIGFNSEMEKEFFQNFISVDAIGPLKAVKALSCAIGDIANAIESNDIKTLKNLKGIGPRTAQKIVAALGGKMEKFVQINKNTSKKRLEDFSGQVLSVLMDQLGYKIGDAKHLIAKAFERNPDISTSESLFDEILGNI